MSLFGKGFFFFFSFFCLLAPLDSASDPLGLCLTKKFSSVICFVSVSFTNTADADTPSLPNGPHCIRFRPISYTGVLARTHRSTAVWSYCTRSTAEFTPVFNGTTCGVH